MRKLEGVIGKYADIIIPQPGFTQVLKHSILTGDSPPIRSPPHAISAVKATAISREIDELLKCGTIRLSVSPWASAVVPVTKPDGSVRLSADYRHLNVVTQPDPYCMPLIEDLLHKVG